MINGLFDIISHANGAAGMAAAALVGSVLMLPGFIVFPLCGVFARAGVPYFILSALTTTMMMVGVVTFPMEKSYLGFKPALVRNLIGFVIPTPLKVMALRAGTLSTFMAHRNQVMENGPLDEKTIALIGTGIAVAMRSARCIKTKSDFKHALKPINTLSTSFFAIPSFFRAISSPVI